MIISNFSNFFSCFKFPEAIVIITKYEGCSFNFRDEPAGSRHIFIRFEIINMVKQLLINLLKFIKI